MFTEFVPIADLLLDKENPRLEVQQNQTEAIVAMAKVQGEKLLRLAKDILQNRLNPADLLFVLPTIDDKKRYIVLEGNRRVASLKIMSTPELLAGAIPAALEKQFRLLNAKFALDPIEKVECVVVQTREEADHWIRLKHAGEQQGAGTVDWGGIETERYQTRLGKKSPSLTVLEVVKSYGLISDEAKENLGNIKITNLSRLLSDPYIREKLGISMTKGVISSYYPDVEAAKGLSKIIEDLALERIKVTDIDNKAQRAQYINAFSSNALPDPAALSGSTHEIGDDTVSSTASEVRVDVPVSTKRRSRPRSVDRTTLISKTCHLDISETRINNIYIELKRVSIEEFPNAVSVLFRVFAELSLDHYIYKIKADGVTFSPISSVHENTKLRNKLDAVAKYFEHENVMTHDQLQAVIRAASGDHLLASAIPTLHAYVHNRFFSPSSSDLKIAWDDLQSFFENLWK